MKENSKGIKEGKKAPQLSLKEKRRLKKEKKNRWVRKGQALGAGLTLDISKSDVLPKKVGPSHCGIRIAD